MHELMNYVCDEIDELEKKVGQQHNLTVADLQYADTLVSIKKNMKKLEQMDAGGGYGAMDPRYMPPYYYDGSGYTGQRRDSMGRYAEGDYTPRGSGYARGGMGDYDARRGGREPDGYSMVRR